MVLTGALIAAWAAVAVPASADTAPAAGLPETVSADGLPTWQINGVAWSQVLVGNTVYVAGSFTKARPPGVAVGGAGEVNALNVFAYDITTGNRVASFNHSLNAQGLAITASPDGSRIYVGGDFTTVDGVAHSHVAAFNTATGALDNSFTANVSNQVRALAASSSALYIGGGYGAVNGSTRTNLAAVTATTGALLPWRPTATGGAVWAMVLAPDGSRVIAGGSFTTLSGQPAYGMGSLSTADGSVQRWDANQAIRDAGPNAAITSLRADGQQIYGTGYSFDIPTGNFEGTFAADPSTGVITTVNPCHGDTYDVLPVGQVMYEVSHTHDCTWAQGFPDTEPRVRWEHALAWTIAPTGTATGPDNYGWNLGGFPDSTLLHWYPQIPAGTYTGQGQAGWSLAGNSDYIAMGGEFPKVNGVAQQGLVRFAVKTKAPNKRGPSYTTNPNRPVPATTATSFSSGTARVSFGTAWDYDNTSLTYDVLRDNGTTPVYTTKINSNFWTLPSGGFLDTGLTPGSTHTYQVRITDPFGNIQWSPKSNVVTISSGTQSQYAADISADGAEHYWRLGEPSGSTSYDWVGFDDLSLNGGVTRGAPGAIAGDADGASTFDGNTGSAADPYLVVAPDVFTQEAWFRTTSTTGGKIVGFGNQATGNSSAYDRHLYLDAAGHVYFGVYNNGIYTSRTSGTFNDGQWHHVAGTLDGTGMTLYVDGKKVGQNAGTTIGHPYSGYWRIGGDSLGGWPADGSYFNGDIDDVAIYDKALTLDEVVKHYTDSGRTVGTTPKPTDAYGKSVYDSAPDFYWRLGESNGTVAKDVTSNEADGLYSGGVTFGTTGAVAGTADKAVTLNGSDGAVATSDSISNPTVYSQELWFKTAAGYASGGKLIGFGSSQTGLSGAYDRHVYMFDDGRLRFGVWTGGPNLADTTKSYNDGTWHHLVATQGPDGMKLYVDGTLDASNPQTQAVAYDGYWRVGGDNTWGGNSSNYFAGAIDEVAVYSKVLDLGTVQGHYQIGSGNLPNQVPSAAFTSSVNDLQASFDGSGSSDPDGTIASYAWDFGDSTPAGSGATPSHTYAAAGTYTVELTVTDNKGATDSVSHDITVTAPNQKPVAAFTSSVSNLQASFDGSGSQDPDGTVSSCAWDFGDSTAAGSGATPSHTYATAGTYPVKLTVTDNKGATDSVSHDVTVAAPTEVAKDAFDRTVSNGWGSADVGGSWTVSGTSSNYSVASSAGKMQFAVGTTRTTTLNSVSATNVDVTSAFRYDKAGTGGGIFTSLLARRIGTSDYRVKVVATGTATTLQLVRTVNGTETVISSQAVSGMVYAPGDEWNMRFQVEGTGTTTLRAKIWKSGTTEPSAWRLTATDTTASLQAPGAVGILGYLSGSATNAPVVLSVQDFVVKPLA